MNKEIETSEDLEDKICDVCGEQVQNEDYETLNHLIEVIVDDGNITPTEHHKFCSEKCFKKWVKEKEMKI